MHAPNFRFGLALACAVVGLFGIPRFTVQAAPAYTTVVVQTNGHGSVSPNYNGRTLRVGSWLFPVVRPAHGYLFAGWTSSQSHILPLDSAFIVEPGLELTANFIPNPFLALGGEYNGLFYQSNGIAHATAGYFSVRLNQLGNMRLRVIVGGRSYDLFGGPYDGIEADGVIQGWRYDLSGFIGDVYEDSLRQVLHALIPVIFSSISGQLAGSLDNSQDDFGQHQFSPTWTADMLAYQASFHARTNPAPQAGTYTLFFPGGDGDGTNVPAGHGFAAVTISTGGRVSMTGSLADGTPIVQNTTLSQNGRWPLFVNLYGGRGSVLGWVDFAEQDAAAASGTVLWTKPPGAPTQAYAAGFSNSVPVTAYHYHPPIGRASALSLTNGIAVFTGGGLPSAPLTNTFALKAGRITNTSANRFNLTIKTATGLFNGTFRDPASGKTLFFQGALLQEQNSGYGYFLGANGVSGSVYLAPVP